MGEYMNYLILVNKDNGLSKLYKPSNLVKIKSKINKDIYLERKTYKEAERMLNDLNKELSNIEVIIDSGYRSYNYQEELNKLEPNNVGITLAKAGYSEHQTGLAIDVGFIKDGLHDPYYNIEDYSMEFKWLRENSYKYGFILRYPLGKENITGYKYEPWHYRYIGNLANYLYKKNKTLEEFFNVK